MFIFLTAATTTLLLALPLIVSSAPSPSPSLNIVAHQDDDLFFQSPSLLHSLRSNAPHRTIYLTAGDAGNTSAYWASRNEGSRAAYASMLDVPNRWALNEKRIAEKIDADMENMSASVSVYTLLSHPHISLAFMFLPDGFPDGSGFPRTGNTSLQKLWNGEIETIHAVNGKATYSNETLVRALGWLVREFRPGVVHLQDHTRGPVDGDHSDHFYGARYAREAVGWAFPPTTSGDGDKVRVVGYVGYPVIEWPENVRGRDLNDKKETLYTYAKYDWMVCDSDEDCVGKYEPRWLAREVTVD